MTDPYQCLLTDVHKCMGFHANQLKQQASLLGDVMMIRDFLGLEFPS